MIVVALVVIVLALFYNWSRRTYSYWTRKGVTQVKPIPILGNSFELLSLQKNFGQQYQDIYEKYENEKIIGFYEMTNPVLLVRDPRLIGNILVKDFNHFVNRDDFPSDENGVDAGIQNLKDFQWRGLRYKLIPAFSTGKLKLMFQYIKTCSDLLLQNFQSIPNVDVDLQEISTMYVLDVIATCAFGIDVKQDINKNSTFRKMGMKISSLDTFTYYCFLLVNLNSKLAAKLKLPLTSGAIGQFFSKIVKDTMTLREQTGYKRNDFVDLLLELKNKGYIDVQNKIIDPDDSYLVMDEEPGPETFKITEPMLLSQGFTFIGAGFDGMSGSMTHLLYQLAQNQHIQDKLRSELVQLMMKHDGFTYDALKEAKYLDSCINESMRLHPILLFTCRVCTKEYEIIPGVIVQPGTKVHLSIGGLHMDKKYFADPQVFNPDRFSGNLTATVNDFTYLPFGAGPRMCIGMRLSLLIMKMGLATMLTNYKIHPSASTPQKLTLRVKTFFLNKCSDHLLFNVEKINS